MEVNKNYSFNSIIKYAEKNNYSYSTYGDFIVGESFIILKHKEKDITISFVLTSVTNTNSYFKCTYSNV